MLIQYPENRIYFTSDTHFGHKKILGFCHRPFNSIEEHDSALINNWNSVVNPNDTVFHLGDFGFGGIGFLRNIIGQLNGNIILIIGNHDWRNMVKPIRDLFTECVSQARITVGDRTVYLNHFPYLCFERQNPYNTNYAIQLFGHVHSGPLSEGSDIERLQYCFPTQYDVGVDNNNFTPVSWRQIQKNIEFQISTFKAHKILENQ